MDYPTEWFLRHLCFLHMILTVTFDLHLKIFLISYNDYCIVRDNRVFIFNVYSLWQDLSVVTKLNMICIQMYGIHVVVHVQFHITLYSMRWGNWYGCDSILSFPLFVILSWKISRPVVLQSQILVRNFSVNISRKKINRILTLFCRLVKNQYKMNVYP